MQYQGKSTAGLSIVFFIFAVIAESTYSMSIFLYSCDGKFIVDKLPWLFGESDDGRAVRGPTSSSGFRESY